MNKMYMKRNLWIILSVLGVFVYFYIYINTVETEPYRISEVFLHENKKVKEAIGQPLKLSINIFTGYDIQRTSDNKAKAELRINLSGDKSKGTAIVQVESESGKWSITNAFLLMKDQEIDLITETYKNSKR